MKKSDLRWLGDLTMYGGIGLCLLSMLVRTAGGTNLFGYGVMNVFIVGMGLMVFNCMLKLSTRPPEK